MDLIFKSFQIDLKTLTDEKLAKGQLDIVFATMGVWDKDGDLAVPGFYGEQDVVMVPTHDWSHVPIGKGKTSEVGNQARAMIQMNLELQAAKDWLSAIKFDLRVGKPLQEYSYGFKVLEGGSEMGEMLGRRGRILKPREDGTPGSKIWEVSPVLVGAGEKTGTVSAKDAKIVDVTENSIRIRVKEPSLFIDTSFRTTTLSASRGIQAVMGKLKNPLEGQEGSMVVQSYIFDKDKWTVTEARAWVSDHKDHAGKTFIEESQAVLDAADELIERAKALAALREKEGREISAPNKEKLAALASSFQEYAKTMASLVAPAPVAVAAPNVEAVEARRELVRMTKVRAGLT